MSNPDSRLSALAERILQKNLEFNKSNAFSPSASAPETKAERTTSAAKAVVDLETQRRDEKTARLRAARLKRDAGAPSPSRKKQK
jgi:hypothetical protein